MHPNPFKFLKLKSPEYVAVLPFCNFHLMNDHNLHSEDHFTPSFSQMRNMKEGTFEITLSLSLSDYEYSLGIRRPRWSRSLSVLGVPWILARCGSGGPRGAVRALLGVPREEELEEAQ